MIRPRLHAVIVAHVAASYVAGMADISANVVWHGASWWLYAASPFLPIVLPVGVAVLLIQGMPISSWLFLGASYLLTFGLVYRVLSRRYAGSLRRQRLVAGFCAECGYDLWASRERCPECGTEMPENVGPGFQGVKL